ncbi:hypothetical protein [Flavihumibacter fluvii]|uniref:hypothetical protein n=1 Tax=Flavihumibacter fluvii TaxID=2838157 RepID=UPI001BDEA19F|nr:hypothetical protein [Flavihumibacter fluvii]ULQ51177.1 hypothetical protein KJS93_13895 [Flavihumibacter fluvii]
MKTYQVILPFFLLAAISSSAQVFTNKEVGQKNVTAIDSIKQSEYPYSLPIWGKQATKAGYSLPYSAGVSVQYFWQESDLIIDNLKVGFNNGPMYELDGLVRFDKAVATASAFTVRPDVWLFPFLDVYGILGKSQASTDVGFGVWIKDSTNTEKEIFSTGSIVKFNATTFGFGMTPTIGVGGGFLALDMNVAWTDVPQLDKPAFTFVFGPRLGKNFKVNKKKPEQSIAVWAGGFRVHLNSSTTGSINLNDVLPVEEMGGKIESANGKVADAQQQVDTWWAGLSQTEQNNPVNEAKYNAANATLERAGEILNAAEGVINNVETATVQYSMDKKPKDMWNFIVGSQFQLNKHLMFRAEAGFLSSRIQFMGGLQYRFGL